jgi:Nitroreductase family
VSVAKIHFDRNGKENHHAFHDVGAAACNLTTQALALDLFVHQMGGFNAEIARSQFGIPSGYQPVAMMAITSGRLCQRVSGRSTDITSSIAGSGTCTQNPQATD